jgi:hypothetical protein
MKPRRAASGAALGALIATVVCWGALYAFGALRGAGSLFDTSPKVANLFFMVWIGFAAMAFLVGGYLGCRCWPRSKAGGRGIDSH